MAIIENGIKNYIIILNYNSWKDTIECVEAVINSSCQNFQVILIDNKSTNDSELNILKYLNGKIEPKVENTFYSDKISARKNRLPYFYYTAKHKLVTRDLILENTSKKDFLLNNYHVLLHPIIFIQTAENLGFAGGNNVGLNMILNSNNIDNNSNVLLLNPDTFISTETLNELQKIEDEFFMSSCAIKDYETPKEIKFYGAYKLFKPFALLQPIKSNKTNNNIDYIYGGALFTNIKTIKKIGLLPEEYFLFWEETDWCFLAKQNDVKLIICEKAIVYDKVGTSIGRGYLAHYYYIKNGLFFYQKHLKQYLFSLIIFNGVRYLNKIRKGEFENARAIIDGTKDFFKKKQGNSIIS